MTDELPDQPEIGPRSLRRRSDRLAMDAIQTPSGDIAMPSSDINGSSDTVLACTGCEVYYDARDEWEYCPSCAESLKELQSAET